MANRNLCEIRYCENPSGKNGWCDAHQARWERWGHPERGAPVKGMRKPEPSEALTLLYSTAVNPPGDECVVWPFALTPNGYPVVNRHGKTELAHRLALMVGVGPPPFEGAQAGHEPVVCHDPRCINPRHLRWVTAKQNAADRKLDGTDTISRLTPDQVRHIRKGTEEPRVLAERYGVGLAAINNALWGQTYREVAE